jgi:recombination protein RecA
MMHGQGTNRVGEIVDLASERGIIDKSGAWYSYKGERIGQGRENSVAFLAQNPDLEKAIGAELMAKCGVTAATDAASAAATITQGGAANKDAAPAAKAAAPGAPAAAAKPAAKTGKQAQA